MGRFSVRGEEGVSSAGLYGFGGSLCGAMGNLASRFGWIEHDAEGGQYLLAY